MATTQQIMTSHDGTRPVLVADLAWAQLAGRGRGWQANKVEVAGTPARERGPQTQQGVVYRLDGTKTKTKTFDDNKPL